jgi:hypothetical protein
MDRGCNLDDLDMTKTFFNMKKYFLSIILLSCLQQMQGQTVVQTIETLERQRFEAQVKKNFPVLEKIFADDLVYIHGSGKKDSKTTYLKSIQEGKSVYDQITVDSIQVRPYANDKVAVVNGVITITNANVPSIMRYLVVYHKNRKKGWQLNSWQALKLAKS